ncbi:PIR protein [Plasmodium ovale]|uniref:PIR protein n=2 Tax=Plasmodium ovale TaxID=36330 RepID=A0A1D3JDC6_PLAOA|nr:PIR protein [Plasmodium ovale]
MGNDEDPDINGLYSNVIYHQLDKATKDDFFVDDNYWNSFIKTTNIQLSRDRTSFLNVFYYVANLRNNEIFYNERWNYLFFWLGIKLINNSEESIFDKVMSVLQTIRSSRVGTRDFYNDDMFNVNKEQFQNLKKIYDYLQSYTSIRAKINFKDAPCTKAYKDYVTESYDFYIAQKTQCKQKDTDNYCRVVNRFVKEYVKEDLTRFTCNGTKDPKVRAEMDEVQDSLVHHHSQEQGPQGLRIHSGREEETHYITNPDAGVSASPRSTNTTSVVFPLLGTLSMFFVWFKFSPLGSLLYNSMFKKKIIRNYEQEEEQEILESPYAFPHRSVVDSEHHIAYHST